MIQIKSPYCRGSNKPSHTNDKRALCYWCSNLVAVRDGRLCQHWWSRRAHRYTSTAFKRSNR